MLALAATLACALLARAVEVPFTARAEHVVLIVWDGMRPDFIRAETTPVLHALAERGTFFANHHSVYVTSTEVNGAALATGCYPARTGIVANVEYRPAINLAFPVATENAVSSRLGDIFSEGRYLHAPTLAELIQRAGHRTAVAGTKPVALLHDRAFDRTAAPGSVILFAGKTYPPSALPPLTARFGKFPEYPSAEILAPNTAQNAWTARALTESLWRDGIPRFSTLWLGDPDYSQHLTEPGSATARAALRDCDTHLGLVLAALHAKGVLEKTDLFIVSDHGFSTVDRAIDLMAILKKAGFPVVRSFAKTPAAPPASSPPTPADPATAPTPPSAATTSTTPSSPPAPTSARTSATPCPAPTWMWPPPSRTCSASAQRRKWTAASCLRHSPPSITTRPCPRPPRSQPPPAPGGSG